MSLIIVSSGERSLIISGGGGKQNDADVGISHAVYVGVSTDGRDGPIVPHSMNDSRELQQRLAASSP